MTLNTNKSRMGKPEVVFIHLEGDETIEEANNAVDILMEFFLSHICTDFSIRVYGLTAEDQQQLKTLLSVHCDDEENPLVVCFGQTLAGSGNAVSACIQSLCPKPMPGFGEQIRCILQPVTPAAMLLMPFAGIRRKTVMVHLPAEPDWLAAILPALFPAIPNAVFLATGLRLNGRN